MDTEKDLSGQRVNFPNRPLLGAGNEPFGAKLELWLTRKGWTIPSSAELH